ncbi:MAG TPA: hypothetical protein PK843_05525 [bacterium]|nr:hypothetical protein [bacterium]
MKPLVNPATILALDTVVSFCGEEFYAAYLPHSAAVFLPAAGGRR